MAEAVPFPIWTDPAFFPSFFLPEFASSNRLWFIA
jgi:hypothetical protein